jgi:hypothetical protein
MSGSLYIEEARSVRDLRAIILFPWQLYRNDALWVPPIVADRLARFDPVTNPMLRPSWQCSSAHRSTSVTASLNWHYNKPVGQHASRMTSEIKAGGRDATQRRKIQRE